MSNLMQMPEGRGAFRKKLLAGVSVSSLAALLGTAQAAAGDSKPAFWLELGAQFEHRSGEDAPFMPVFTQELADNGIFLPLEIQKPPKFSFGGEGSIAYRPEDSDWTFSASILFGRSNGDRHRYETKSAAPVPNPYISGKYLTGPPISTDLLAHYKESHSVLDFTAGKDVGLGLFGRTGTSNLAFGVRIAQFSAKEYLSGVGVPPESISFPQSSPIPLRIESDEYTVSSRADRNFKGIGPELRWSGSAPIAGNADDEELAIDWDVHGAALFGRQRTQLLQSTADHRESNHGVQKYDHTYTLANDDDRARSLIVPNIGASVALSLKFSNAKITIGYRADEFFNAMDTGVDTRKPSNVLFHGPFASISIGASPFDL